MIVEYLECDHCGGPAVYADDGLYCEDSGDACITCGMPGHVSVDGDDDDAEAWWSMSDYGTCMDPGCDDPDCRAMAMARAGVVLP